MSGTVPAGPAFSASFGIPVDVFRFNLYNAALRYCGNTRLSSLTDTQEARYLLDDAWNNGAAQDILEQGLWYFAKRTTKLTFTADANTKTNFGFNSAFLKPQDWVRTMAVCSDDRFQVPITAISDEAGYLYCDLATIFFAYVSNDPLHGNDFSRWPQTFYNAVGAHLAEMIVWKLTTSEKKVAMVEKKAHQLLNDARSKAAMNESAAFLPLGSWIRARLGNRVGLDQGNRNSLYG